MPWSGLKLHRTQLSSLAMPTSALSPLRKRNAARVSSSPRRIAISDALATARDAYWERVAWRLSRLELIFHKIARRLIPPRDEVALRNIRQNRLEILNRGKQGYRISAGEAWTVGVEPSALETGVEVEIGEIDQDGYVYAQPGALVGIPTVTAEEFVPRNRFGLTLVARDGTLAVRKNYRGNRVSFIREVHALDLLGQQGCNVPALLDIDPDRLQIVMSYVDGTVVREGLANQGATLRDRDVESRRFTQPTIEELHLAKIQEGRNVLHAVVDDAFIEELFRQLRIMHSNRFIWGDVKYGNIVIERHSDKPFIIDFEGATHHPRLGERAFRRLADRDIEEFNLHFDSDKLTTARLRRRVHAIQDSNVYAPACFTSGISVGNLWDKGNGYGRWHFLLKHALPPIKNARVLDLGANNGFNSLQLLRTGAREVVAVELDDQHLEQGKLLHASYEYMDYANYEFRYIKANIKDIITMDLGQFDFVMALCSIYDLAESEIAAVADHVSTITDTFVLQCNTQGNIRPGNPQTDVKASIEYAQKLLSDAGFCEINVIAPQNYHKPLVIGRQSN